MGAGKVSTESSQKIADVAAHWLVRRYAESWTEQDQQALEEWLQGSTAHRVAFLRLQAAWKRAGRLNALGAGLPEGTVPSPSNWQSSPFFDPLSQSNSSIPLPSTAEERPQVRGGMREKTRRRLQMSFAAAAGLVIVAIGVGGWRLWPAGKAYETAIGGVATVPMVDGSKVILNTDSKVRIEVNDKARLVQLERGEAYFAVAKDPARPFIVTAGSKHVTAVGTAFSVRRDGADLRVTVTEGVVKFGPAEIEAVAPEPLHPTSTAASLITAGQTVRATADNVLIQKRPLPQLEETLTWRSGYLTFHETTLADAVAEFNRYNPRRMVIADPHLASIKLSGKFESTQFEAFLRLIQGGFPIIATPKGDAILLTSRE
jgi:transmembrane sensor